MKFSPFSCPIFLGHPEARGRCSQGERVLYGRDLCCSGGTGKAEAAKLQGAGIGPKQCPGKCATEKIALTRLSESDQYRMKRAVRTLRNTRRRLGRRDNVLV